MNEEHFPSADAYERAFRVLQGEGIPPKHIALLQAHFKAPNQTATWAQLGESVGYASGNAVNLQYGKLASRVAHQLGYMEPPSGFWLFVLADWAKERDWTGHTAFVLRPPVIEALTQLGVFRQTTTGSIMATDSVVGKLRKDLERLGEYVVRANISSGWFAVFPGTWKIRSEAAKRDGREGPSLIVYRTNSGNPRDHYRIPYGVVRDLLVESTITQSEVNGSRRWNLTLKNGKLHVTHLPGTKDVSGFHGLPLIVEGNGSSAFSQARNEFDDSFAILEGIAREVTVIARSRSRKLRNMALKRSKGVCEACKTDFSALFGGKGLRVLQVHHRRQLALQDAPNLVSPDDLAVVCANCHAIIHADPLEAISVEDLRDQWCREKAGAPNPSGGADGNRKQRGSRSLTF